MKKGDIVLIPFPFSDLLGVKNRPAVILIVTDLDVTVAFITTQMKWAGEFDLILQPTESNGLKIVSLIRLQKLATIDKELLIGCLGLLDGLQLKVLDNSLIRMFQLENTSNDKLDESFLNLPI